MVLKDTKAFIVGFVVSMLLSVGILIAWGPGDGEEPLLGEHADVVSILVNLADQGEDNYRGLRRKMLVQVATDVREAGGDAAAVRVAVDAAAAAFDGEHADWRAAHTDFGLGVCDYLGMVHAKRGEWQAEAGRAITYTVAKYKILREFDKLLPPMPDAVPAMGQIKPQ